MFYANLAELPRRLARLSRCPKNAERVQSRGGTRTSARVRRPELVPRLHMYRSRSPDRIAARCHSPRLRHNAAVKLGDHQFRCRRALGCQDYSTLRTGKFLMDVGRVEGYSFLQNKL